MIFFGLIKKKRSWNQKRHTSLFVNSPNKNCDPKKCMSNKILGQKNVVSNKNCGSRKCLVLEKSQQFVGKYKLQVQNKFGSNKFLVQQFLCTTNVGSNTFFCAKTIWGKNTFWSITILSPTIFMSKIFGSKLILGQSKF